MTFKISFATFALKTLFETKSSTTGITQVGHFCYQITYVDTENCKTLPCVYLVSKKAISYCIRFPDRLHHIAHTVTSHFFGKSRKSWIAPKNASFPDAPIFLIAIERLRQKSGTNRKKKEKKILLVIYIKKRDVFIQSVKLLEVFKVSSLGKQLTKLTLIWFGSWV